MTRKTPMHYLIYLAGPYTSQDPMLMEWRFEQLTRVKAQLLNEGHLVYSPITAGHVTAIRHNLPREYAFWQRHCEAFVSRCDEVMVLALPGWANSKGVTAELALAKEHGIPVRIVRFTEPRPPITHTEMVCRQLDQTRRRA